MTGVDRVESLSPLNRELIERLRRNPAMAQERPNPANSTIPDVLGQFRFPVGAWPIVISQHVVRGHFDPLVAALPQIFYEAIRAYFRGDRNSFNAYFGWPRPLYDALVRAPVDMRDLLVRYDAVLGGQGLKLLEINCGSALGGWQLDYFQADVRARLESYAGIRDWNIGYRRVFHGMLRGLLAGILRRKPGKAQGHLLFHTSLRSAFGDLTSQHGAAGPGSFGKALQTAYDEIRPPALPRGRIVLFEDFAEIHFAPGGEVVVAGEAMDAVVLAGASITGVPEHVMGRLTIAYLSQHIVFPDSPLHRLLGDKRLFALVHECRTDGLLGAHEAALIENHVPWTARLRDTAVTLEGARVPLVPLLLEQKDAFVLKRADSYAGQHVVVGRGCDARQWQAAIARGQEEGLWIAQRFCEPGRLEVCGPGSAVAPHDLIWGIFSFGGEYAGAFVRARPSDGHTGVINAESGATEFLVYEEVGANGNGYPHAPGLVST